MKKSFNIWYEENKESDELNDSYHEYVNESNQMDEKPESKVIWARKSFEVNQGF